MPGGLEVDLYEPKYAKHVQSKATKKSTARKGSLKPKQTTTRRKPAKK
jgi:hypothetical protein